MAFAYLGSREPIPSPPEDDLDAEDYFDVETGTSGGQEPDQEFYTKPDMKSFLFFVESLTALYVWPHPEFWPEVWDRLSLVKDISGL